MKNKKSYDKTELTFQPTLVHRYRMYLPIYTFKYTHNHTHVREHTEELQEPDRTQGPLILTIV